MRITGQGSPARLTASWTAWECREGGWRCTRAECETHSRRTEVNASGKMLEVGSGKWCVWVLWRVEVWPWRGSDAKTCEEEGGCCGAGLACMPYFPLGSTTRTSFLAGVKEVVWSASALMLLLCPSEAFAVCIRCACSAAVSVLIRCCRSRCRSNTSMSKRDVLADLVRWSSPFGSRGRANGSSRRGITMSPPVRPCEMMPGPRGPREGEGPRDGEARMCV